MDGTCYHQPQRWRHPTANDASLQTAVGQRRDIQHFLALDSAVNYAAGIPLPAPTSRIVLR
jgi:hypothetical protein